MAASVRLRPWLCVAALLLLAGGGWFVWKKTRASSPSTAAHEAPLATRQARLRERFVEASTAAHAREVAEVNQLRDDLPKYHRLRQAAEEAHRHRLHRAQRLAGIFTGLDDSPDRSPALAELSRRLEDEGIAAALAYAEGLRGHLLSRVPSDPAAARRQLEPLLRGAQLAATLGMNAEAESLFRDLLRPAHPGWPTARHQFWDFLYHAKSLEVQSRGTAAVVAHCAEMEAIARQLIAEQPDAPESKRDLALSHLALGELALGRGDFPDALRRFIAAREILRKLAAAEPAEPLWQDDLAVIITRLGIVAHAQADLQGALQYYDEAARLQQQLAADHPTEPARQIAAADAQLRGIELLQFQGKPDEALKKVTAAFEAVNKALAVDPHDPEAKRALYRVHWSWALLAERRGNNGEARGHWQAAHVALSELDRKGVYLSPQDRAFLRQLEEKLR